MNGGIYFFDAGRRLAEAQRPDESVGLLFVVYRHVHSFKPVDRFVNQVLASCRRAQQLNPMLSIALATNLALSSENYSAFDHIVSLNGSVSHTGSIWETRLVALYSSPFALTLELDATSFVCSARLYPMLLHTLRHDPVDFAVNFEASPLLRDKSSALGSPPRRVEDMLPHNCAMLVRRGNGSSALLRRWRANMGEPGLGDDQLALRATLRGLASTAYNVCDDEPSRWSSTTVRLRVRRQAAELARLDRQPRALCTRAVHVRVGRLTESIVGFKSADKKMPGWRQVPPRYTRPIVGEVLLVHSGGSGAMCTELNRDSPTLRIISQVYRVPPPRNASVVQLQLASTEAQAPPPLVRGAHIGASTFASLTSREECTQAFEAAVPVSKWALSTRVCDFLPKVTTRTASGAKDDMTTLLEPLETFWLWVVEHSLTNHKSRSVRSSTPA